MEVVHTWLKRFISVCSSAVLASLRLSKIVMDAFVLPEAFTELYKELGLLAEA